MCATTTHGMQVQTRSGRATARIPFRTQTADGFRTAEIARPRGVWTGRASRASAHHSDAVVWTRPRQRGHPDANAPRARARVPRGAVRPAARTAGRPAVRTRPGAASTLLLVYTVVCSFLFSLGGVLLANTSCSSRSGRAPRAPASPARATLTYRPAPPPPVLLFLDARWPEENPPRFLPAPFPCRSLYAVTSGVS